MDLFGFKARKQAKIDSEKAEQERIEIERLEQAKREKEIYQARKRKIDQYLKEYHSNQFKIASQYADKANEAIKKENGICPKCGSVNVINHIKRVKGEVHGNGSTSSYSFGSHSLFSGCYTNQSYGNSKLDGELDTFPVNKCKDCGHEWEITEEKRVSDYNRDDFSHYDSSSPGYFFRRVREYLNMEYDPYDVTEKFNSLQEKLDNLVATSSKIYVLDAYRTAPKYMLEYALYEGIDESVYSKNNLDPRFGTVLGKDKYSYRMPEELWEIVKIILGWRGEEE
jgi:ribosomal protein S27AE